MSSDSIIPEDVRDKFEEVEKGATNVDTLMEKTEGMTLCPRCKQGMVYNPNTGEPVCGCGAEEENAMKLAALRSRIRGEDPNAKPKVKKKVVASRNHGAVPVTPKEESTPKPVPAPVATSVAQVTKSDTPVPIPAAPQKPQDKFTAAGQTARSTVEAQAPQAPAMASQGTLTVREALAELGGPDANQIDMWKSEHGQHSVHALPISPKKIFVFRSMKYREWVNLTSEEQFANDQRRLAEHTIARSVLWPKMGPTETNMSEAGLIDTLFNVIMFYSDFVPPEMAIGMVEEL